MLLRSEITDAWIELVTVSRAGFETVIHTARAEPGDLGYADLLAQIEQGTFEDFVAPPGLPPSGVAPMAIDLSDWPVGTMMRITNEDGDQVVYDEPAAPMTLIDPGWYRIEIAPPLPYHATVAEIDVTDA